VAQDHDPAGSPHRERLRARVRAETGLPVSVGIGPVKMVAKIASDLAKPDGLLEVAPDGVRDFLDPLPVGRIWGVGPVAQERLAQAGIHSVGDLARVEPERLGTLLGDCWHGFEAIALASNGAIKRAACNSQGPETTTKLSGRKQNLRPNLPEPCGRGT